MRHEDDSDLRVDLGCRVHCSRSRYLLLTAPRKELRVALRMADLGQAAEGLLPRTVPRATLEGLLAWMVVVGLKAAALVSEQRVSCPLCHGGQQ